VTPRAAGAAARHQGPASGAAPVVVLRALGLGDVLTIVPALRGLRRRFPGRSLLLAGPRAPAQLLQQYGVVDGVIATPALGAAPPGRGLTGHVAVNLHGRGPQSHRLLLAGGPSRLIAYANGEVAVPGPVWNRRDHEVYRWCRLVAWGAGDAAASLCDPTDLFLDEPVTTSVAAAAGASRARNGANVPDHRGVARGIVRVASEAGPDHGEAGGRAQPSRTADTGLRTGPVVIHPGSASMSRRWPAERFAAVAAALSRRGHPVVVTGGSSEASMCRRLASRAGLGSAADLSGRLTLPNLVALLRRSRLLISADTGVAHLATALRTPSVVLFGPTAPQLWGPLVDQHLHRVLWHGRPDLPCDPHSSVPDPALLEITVRETLEAAITMLSGVRDASFA
jgi:ADP-heptose:LPS heptosyltransferase